MVTLILDPRRHNPGFVSSDRKGVATQTILLAFIVLIPWAHAQPAGLQWSRATPSGAIPSPRIDALVAYDPLGRQVGVLQVNVRLPVGVAGNPASVLLTVGEATSQKDVVVSVQ
jgi:uncharacterized protein (TIGR03437 family)